MPATVVYKSGYPSTAAPVETSANVGSDGLITGSAMFVVTSGSTAYPLNSPVSQALFPSLAGVNLQNLVVSSRSLEKRGGLFFLNITVVGVINPPIVTTEVDVSPRSISKQREDADGRTIVGSFDYLAERCVAKCIYAEKSSFRFDARDPQLIQVYNVVGSISILQASGFPQWGLPTSIFANAPLSARPIVLRSESKQIQNGIVTHTKTAELVYQ